MRCVARPIDTNAIADYWLVCRKRLALSELYRLDGRYQYRGGANGNSVIALIVGIAVPPVGLFIPELDWLWDNALIVGLLMSMIVYIWLMRGDKTLVLPRNTSGSLGSTISGQWRSFPFEGD
jgi:nucleobase:cation symporter-1, NCS1 family